MIRITAFCLRRQGNVPSLEAPSTTTISTSGKLSSARTLASVRSRYQRRFNVPMTTDTTGLSEGTSGRPEPFLDPAGGPGAGEVAAVDDSPRGLDQGLRGGPGKAPADAHSLGAGLLDLAEAQAETAEGKDVHRLGHRAADSLDL